MPGPGWIASAIEDGVDYNRLVFYAVVDGEGEGVGEKAMVVSEVDRMDGGV